MLLGVAEAMTEKGYVGTSVADVLQRAGVSRETFYQQFSSKLDCFLAAFDAAAEILLDRLLGGARRPTGTALERFDGALTAYLDTLATVPAYARLFLVEVYAAGPEAHRPTGRGPGPARRRPRRPAGGRRAPRSAPPASCWSPAWAPSSSPPSSRATPTASAALRDPILALATSVLDDR